MIFEKKQLIERMDAILEERMSQYCLEYNELDEVAMTRRVRKGKIVRKVKQKRKGYKVVRKGNQVKFKRMTYQEKRTRRKSARKAWRKGKASRINKTKRTMIRSKVRMKTLYRK